MEQTPLPTLEDLAPEPVSKYRLALKVLIALFCVIATTVFFYFWSVRPPANFPSQTIIEIKPGTGLIQISKDLKRQGIVRSAVLFEFVGLMYARDGVVSSGMYYLEEPLSSTEIAYRLAHAKYNLSPVRITIPEGYTVRDINQALSAKLIDFDSATFLALAKDAEGYLFPDTYFFYPTATAETAYREMRQNFARRVVKNLEGQGISDTKLHQLVTMGSLLEKEAANTAEMPTIAGILHNRLKKKMALQVDASFLYLLGKKSSDLTLADLKIDSPYNTYMNKGLPPGPINNPGLRAIEAALHPAETPYYFYLHDKDGIIHYAKTFEEHKANKRKYLN